MDLLSLLKSPLEQETASGLLLHKYHVNASDPVFGPSR